MLQRTAIIRNGAAVLLAASAVAASWNLGWLAHPSAKGLQPSPAAVRGHELPPSRGTSLGPAVSELSLDNASVAPTDAGESHAIPARWLAGMVEQASMSQRPALEDGVITLAERNDALAAAQQCTVESTAGLTGVVTKDLQQFPGPYATFGGATAPTQDLLVQWSTVHLNCVTEYFRDVATAWSAAAEYARIAPRWNATAACMRKEGATVAADADFDELMAQSVKFSGSRGLYDSCSAKLP